MSCDYTLQERAKIALSAETRNDPRWWELLSRLQFRLAQRGNILAFSEIRENIVRIAQGEQP